MRNKKGAIELSMTTVVVIVIGVVLLSLGLIWVRGLFEKISGLTEQAFTQADQEIREKMGGTEKFYVSGQNFNIKPGQKLTMSLGIQNFEESGSFTLRVTKTGGTEGATQPVIKFIVPGAENIGAGEKKGLPIVAEIPKNAVPEQTYLFKIAAMKGGTEYASQIIVINIVA